MTQQTPYPPAPAPHTGPRPSNGLGTTGFVLGLVGLVLSPIPLIGVVAWPLVVLGVIFSAIGISRARKGRATNKGLSITGLVLSVLGLAVCILWVAVIAKTVHDVKDEANRVVVVTYEVTGDAKNVDIDYSTYGDTISSKNETVATLPWKKQAETNGLVKGGSLIVSTGETGGSVTCKVVVDGKEIETATASGPFKIASCTGF